MADEIALTRAVSDAREAEALVKNELLRRAFNQVKHDFIMEWQQCSNPEHRERMWHAVDVVERVKSCLTKVIQGGKMAQKDLDEIAARNKRKLFNLV